MYKVGEVQNVKLVFFKLSEAKIELFYYHSGSTLGIISSHLLIMRLQLHSPSTESSQRWLKFS